MEQVFIGICYSLPNAFYFRKVDEAIVQILRNRRVECELYHGADSPKKCEKAINDYLVSAAHFFEKCKFPLLIS